MPRNSDDPQLNGSEVKFYSLQDLISKDITHDKTNEKYGAKSLTDSWYLGALYLRYKKLKGIKDVERPDLQSTYKEFVSKKQY